MKTCNLIALVMLVTACGAGTQNTTPAPDAGAPGMSDAGDEADTGVATDAGDRVDLPIENPEPHSMHHSLTLQPGTYVGASVEVKIDEVPRHGLRFFALQVNFADVAWAHGGLQRDPEDGQANWGGLVPGIDYDYGGAEREVLERIQNMPGRTREATWKEGTWYRYDVTRGELETLPPGQYAVLSDEPITIYGPRDMWRWNFAITEVETGEVVWEQYLYVAHPEITRATYWTETGYGITCEDTLSVQWRNPYMELEDGTNVLPKSMAKSMSQSTCPRGSTTDMAATQNGGAWGTTQWYGVERPPDSEHGDVLYDNPL